MNFWKRSIIFGVSTGASFAILVCSAYGILLWYRSRPIPPIPWNKDAIKTSLTGVDYYESHATYSYTLQNMTGTDYLLTLESNFVFNSKLKQEDSLYKEDISTIKDNFPIHLPANQKVVFTIRDWAFLSDEEVKRLHAKEPSGLKGDAAINARKDYQRSLAAILKEEASNLNGFVLFDYRNHYQIDFGVDLK